MHISQNIAFYNINTGFDRHFKNKAGPGILGNEVLCVIQQLKDFTKTICFLSVALNVNQRKIQQNYYFVIFYNKVWCIMWATTTTVISLAYKVYTVNI